MDRHSRLRSVPKSGVSPLPVAIPKYLAINVPSRAHYKYKPPQISYPCTERLKYLETKLATEQLDENPEELSATLLRNH